MQKNDLFEIEITDVGVNGEGIGHLDGMTFFIKDAVVGDKICARATKLKKNYGYARVEEIISPSTFRVKPQCPVSRQCGGCQLQMLSYEKQLAFKEERVRENLVRLGGFAREELEQKMEPAAGMEYPYRYRNKALFPVGLNRDGQIVTGFYAAHTHSIIPVEDCLLGVEKNREVLAAVKRWMESCHVSPYDERTQTGTLRHVLIRYGFATGEIMVCLIINSRKLPSCQKLTEQLQKIKGMASISYNINKDRSNVVLGKETSCIWGQPYITDYIHLCEHGRVSASIAYHISPQSFYQVNPVQTEKLYSTALEYAGLTGQEYVWDLYCGIGTISLFLSQKAKQVYGVEIVPQAIEDAKNNARLNDIRNVEFFVGKVEDVLPEFYGRMGRMNDASTPADDAALPEKHGKSLRADDMASPRMYAESLRTDDTTLPDKYDTSLRADDMALPDKHDGNCSANMLRPDVIVVDPPRKGCDRKCLDTMLQMCPDRIVYVSCDSATLTRDLRILCDGGYEIRRLRVFDQFAQSVHVETVALLGKQNGKPLPDENIKELAAYLGSGNAKPDDTIEIRVDADKVYEILDREKEAKESK